MNNSTSHYWLMRIVRRLADWRLLCSRTTKSGGEANECVLLHTHKHTKMSVLSSCDFIASSVWLKVDCSGLWSISATVVGVPGPVVFINRLQKQINECLLLLRFLDVQIQIVLKTFDKPLPKTTFMPIRWPVSVRYLEITFSMDLGGPV